MNSSHREFYVRTGEGGMRAFDDEMKRTVMREGLTTCLEQGKVTLEEFARINEMIESSDEGIRTVAATVIEAKLNILQDGSNI